MKFLIVTLLFFLPGCSSLPDQEYKRLAKKELNREYALGSLPGTPDNLESIEASKKKRAIYLEEAKKNKAANKRCTLCKIFCALLRCNV